MYFTNALNCIMLKFGIVLFCFLTLSFSGKCQKYTISVNTNYILSSAAIKDQWNVVGGRPDYSGLNGFTAGLDFMINESKKYNYSISIDLLNHGIEGPNSFGNLRQFERFSYIKLAINNYFKLMENIDFQFSPNLNYLTSFNSYSINALKKHKHNNYFGQGFDADTIDYNKLFYGVSLGLQYKTKLGKLRINYNPALRSILNLKDAENFRLYTTNFEIGATSYLFSFQD